MKITIYQNREVYKEESKIGNDSENKVETLEFEFPEEYADFTKYIEFQIKGEKYVDLIENNKYVITREVAKYGKIKTQVVLKKNTENDVMVFKSDIFTLNVSNSINATENLVHTVGIDLIEKIVAKNYEQDVRLNTLEADNTTNKENILNIQNDNTTNKTNIKSLQDDNEVNKTDISNIKQEQTVQNTNIQELQTDNTSNKSKIVNLEMKNAEQDNKIVSLETKNTQQDTSIQTNTESIAQIKEKDTTQDELIEQLQVENTKLKKEINSMQIPGEATGNPIHLTDSSDMECEIAVVGNSEQETREGYNLLIPPATQTKNGITFTVNDDNSITVNGTATENASINFVNSLGSTMLSFEAGTYKLTGCPNGGSDTTYRLGMNLNTGTTYDTGNGAVMTLNSSMTNRAVWLIIYAGTTVSNLTFYPMLIKGTEDKPYEPYGASPSPDYPSEIVTVGQNVNIFDKDNANKINAWIDNSGYFQYSSDFKVLYIQCDKNKDYVVSSKYLRGIAFLNEVPKTGLTSTNFKIQNVTELTLNSQDNTYLAVWYYATASGLTEQEILDSIKIENGLVATPYSPYGQGSVKIDVVNNDNTKSQSVIMPIQQEMLDGDYIDKDGEHHEWCKLVLTGTEALVLADIYQGIAQFEIEIENSENNAEWGNDDKIRAFSNYYRGVIYNNSWIIDNCITTAGDGRPRIMTSQFTDVKSFKAWLKSKYDEGNPVIVYYKLKRPINLELTEVQKSIREQKLYTYKNITNISADGIATLKVNYKKDLETIINNLSATSVAE